LADSWHRDAHGEPLWARVGAAVASGGAGGFFGRQLRTTRDAWPWRHTPAPLQNFWRAGSWTWTRRLAGPLAGWQFVLDSAAGRTLGGWQLVLDSGCG